MVGERISGRTAEEPVSGDEVNYGIAVDDRSPALNADAFECPNCTVYAAQAWSDLSYRVDRYNIALDGWSVSKCGACNDVGLWKDADLVVPRTRSGPAPSADMPSSVRSIYEEARDVSSVSRKSAAALLRLALQHLVDDLEQGPGDINSKIGRLVQAGLDPQVQQAMDVVRVVGNNAVHPGQIDLDADDELLSTLLELLNLIVEQMITRPKRLQGLMTKLPPGAQAAIARRDGSAAP